MRWIWLAGILIFPSASAQAERVRVQRLPAAGAAPSAPSPAAPISPSPGRVYVRPRGSGGTTTAPSGGGSVHVVPRTHFNPNVYRTHRGVRWNRFYHAGNPYWARYYGNHWWWYDPHIQHWSFWWGGHWWYPAPSGLSIYLNNRYYPYNPYTMEIEPPPTVPAPPRDSVRPPNETATASANDLASAGSSVWYSPDSKRLIQVVGNQAEAFLYDNSSTTPTFMTYLEKNVNNVRFIGGAGGKPLEIQLELKDGHFARFDIQGKPLKVDSSQ